MMKLLVRGTECRSRFRVFKIISKVFKNMGKFLQVEALVVSMTVVLMEVQMITVGCRN